MPTFRNPFRKEAPFHPTNALMHSVKRGRKARNWRIASLSFVAALLLFAAVFGAYKYTNHGPNVLPPDVRKQLTFSPFVMPAKAKGYTADDYKFSTAEGKVPILSYVIHTQDGNTVTVSEYTQPAQFTDIPEYKDRFLTNVAKQYATVQSYNGTVYLGRTSKNSNKQLAVMLERGLIVFMSPTKELQQAQWRSLADRLDVQRVVN